MYSFLHELLRDKKGGEIFTLFGAWHFLYIVLTIAIIAAILILKKRKSAVFMEKAIKFFIGLAFGLYVLDMFLMPIAYGEIDIEKLPFHACTAMCITCFLSYHVHFLEKYRFSFVLLGLISNAVYLIYPAGVMWHAVSPISYRVIQTLVFHSVMSIYGILFLVKEYRSVEIKKCYRDLTVVCLMVLWAMIGNYSYNGASGEYSHFFNWFFVVRDPFYILHESISPYVMPIINIIIFFGVEMIIHTIIYLAQKNQKRDIVL